MSSRKRRQETGDSVHRPEEVHEPESRATRERPVKRLLTERAAFQPRNPAPETSTPLSPTVELSSPPQTDTPNADYSKLQSGEYRVPILHIGREELVELFPDDQARIRQLTDLEIEALALEVECALEAIYRLTLRLIWAEFQIGVQRGR